MKKLSKKFKSVGLLGFDKRSLLSVLFLFVLLASIFLPIYQPSDVSAANEDSLCVPQHTDIRSPDSEDAWQTNAFRFVFISRFDLRIGYNETGDCASPRGLSSKYIHNSSIEFAPFVNQVLPFQDEVVNVNSRIYGGYDNGGDRDESIVLVRNWPRDKSDGWELYRNRLGPTINDFFKGATYTIGIEESKIDEDAADCAGDESNFHLVNDNNDDQGVKWICDDNSLRGRGAELTGHIEEIENFNIVFQVNQDATQVNSLFDDNDTEFNFELCTDGTYKNKSCNGDAEIEGLTQEEALAIGDGTKLVTIKNTPEGDVQAVVAGPGNQAGIPGDDDDSDNADGPPSCEEINPGISLSWFICSVINFLDDTIAGLNNAVVQLLVINKDYYTDSGLREAWAYFRNIASFLLIIIGLVMIIGQAITKG